MVTKSSREPVLRSDYAPFPWFISETNLDISIFDEHTRVTVTLVISPNPNKPSDHLILDGEGLSFISAEMVILVCQIV